MSEFPSVYSTPENKTGSKSLLSEKLVGCWAHHSKQQNPEWLTHPQGTPCPALTLQLQPGDFALGAPGSTERDLAASRSLLDAIEIFFRFPITCIWSSFVCRVKRKQSDGTDHSFPRSSQGARSKSPGGGRDCIGAVSLQTCD